MFGGFLLEHGLAVEVRPDVFELVRQLADDTTAARRANETVGVMVTT